MKPVRVLVVDDSATMRGVIAATLSRAPGIEVVGMAADPIEARAAIKQLNPDVMTLDVEMPKMDGLDFLEKVMRLRPMPVVMVSGLTARGAAATIAALELGAVTCVAKPSLENPDAFEALSSCVRAAAAARVDTRPAPSRCAPSMSDSPAYRWDGKMVAIGASTGCVEALLDVLADYPANCPPTLVAVHMPAAFTKRSSPAVPTARAFLRHEGVRIVAEDLGGVRARRVQFWPVSGRARQIYVASQPRLAAAEAARAGAITKCGAFAGGDMELF
jgi:two-component system chemotaxis response regulator CheB